MSRIVNGVASEYDFPKHENKMPLKVHPETIVMIDESLKAKDKEIERLNNIINELEKYTIEQINIVKENMQIIGNEGKRMATRFVVYNEYLDKLKELKEDNDGK